MKLAKIILLTLIPFILSFCGSINTSMVESLTPPIIITTKNDSVVEVIDSEGIEYILYTRDKINYRTSFLSIGDTIKQLQIPRL